MLVLSIYTTVYIINKISYLTFNMYLCMLDTLIRLHRNGYKLPLKEIKGAFGRVYIHSRAGQVREIATHPFFIRQTSMLHL